jgi:hypothetical protein
MNKEKTCISEQKLTEYLDITKKALDIIKILPPESSHLKKAADDLYLMASSYYKDACHYKDQGEYVTAFACVNYAHGYIDAGVRLGLFLGNNSGIFAFEYLNLNDVNK